jgi:UDP-N-acetylglucosamine--N-acetylmuramyl-(pentapeptide) pyrophosphoryl-undecaprenol N-acetylglucosamine transferase
MLIQTGPREHAFVAAAVEVAAPGGALTVVPYIDDMATELAKADLVVCRAGAMTLAELHCLGKPALLVPFPHATDNHQLRNARDCEEAGAAVVLVDSDCDGPRRPRLSLRCWMIRRVSRRWEKRPAVWRGRRRPPSSRPTCWRWSGIRPGARNLF